LRSELANYQNRIEDKRSRLIMLIQDCFVKAIICVPSLRNSEKKINSLAALFVLTIGAEFIRIGVKLGSMLSKQNIDLKFQPILHILRGSYQRLPQFFCVFTKKLLITQLFSQEVKSL
jgi:hypothetical protein